MISTDEALKILEDAHALAEELNGLDERNIESNNKTTTATKARVSNELLFLAHLCDNARVEVLNQYHAFKGKNPPQVNAPEYAQP